MYKDLEKLFKYDWNETTKTFSKMPFLKVAIHKSFLKLRWDRYAKNIFEEFLLIDTGNGFVKHESYSDKNFKKALKKIIHG